MLLCNVALLHHSVASLHRLDNILDDGAMTPTSLPMNQLDSSVAEHHASQLTVLLGGRDSTFPPYYLKLKVGYRGQKVINICSRNTIRGPLTYNIISLIYLN